MLDERFWSKVDKNTPSGCWEWVAYKSPKGYGRFSVNAAVGPRFAHRLSYEDAHGVIPEGALVLHNCDNPSCVNPSHLRIGSHLDNVRDMDTRNRRVVSFKSGENCPTSKLSEQTVREIWRLHLAGKSQTEIVSALGCSKSATYDVCRGRTWRHLDDAPTLKQLKRGGVSRGHNQFSRGGIARDIHPRTKIQVRDFSDILTRYAAGEPVPSIGRSYGVQSAAVYKVLKSASSLKK